MLPRVVRRLPPRVTAATRCDRATAWRPIWLGLTTHAQIEHHPSTTTREASSSSSTRWKTRQKSDTFAQEARTQGLKSRAAFKLLEINDKYRIFRRGDTVVDLGYAPGSWSQVAISKTQPGGRVVGIDVIPAQPPRGVSTIQGNFLSAEIREEVRSFVQDPARGRVRATGFLSRTGDRDGGFTEEELEVESRGLLGRERLLEETEDALASMKLDAGGAEKDGLGVKELDRAEGRVVNVVLSDMSEPWPLTTSRWIKSVSNPFHRMMNTSGMAFRDHAGSMDLCYAALTFCYDTLVTGGHFLCKFYQGSEDQVLELRLKKLFEKVHRIKPDSSRKESKEAYFLGLRRRSGVGRDEVLGDNG